MSDFKNIKDFRKGSRSSYPYQDPTFLSFVLLFDFFDKNNSPLLSKATEDYLISLAEEEEVKKEETTTGNTYYGERLEALRNFKKTLATINNVMPWYWQTLEGLERLQKYDPLNAYWGGDDAVLKIQMLESINLTAAGLMHLYKKAVFDENKWNYIVPANLRKFRMWVYVTEIRTIKNISKPVMNGIPKKLNKDSVDGFPDNFKPTVGISNANSGISGQSDRPFFMFALNFCEFDISSGADFLSNLSKNPEMATGELSIKYEGMENIQARVLNGMITTKYNTDLLSPAPDSENENFDNLGDYIIDKISDKIGGAISSAKDDLKRLAEEKKNELIQKARDLTVNRIPTFENIFQNALKGVDDATDVNQQTRTIGKAIFANVNDTLPITGSAKAALDKAAERSLGNIYDE